MEAFQALREKPTVLLPLALIVASSAAAILVYYNTVDYPWLIDTLVQTAVDRSDGGLSAEQQDQMRKALGMMSPAVMSVISAISMVVILPSIFCLSALYFLIVSATTNDGFKFKEWLSLNSWCSIPMVISSLAAIVNILMNPNGQLNPYLMNPLSFTSFLSLDTQGSIAGSLSYVDVTTLWTLGLVVAGYRHWTKRNLPVTLAVVLGPWALILACILLFA